MTKKKTRPPEWDSDALAMVEDSLYFALGKLPKVAAIAPERSPLDGRRYAPGDYVYQWTGEPGSGDTAHTPDLSESQLSDLRGGLRERGLALATDDRGAFVVEVAS